MISQLGCPTFFFTLSAADTKWPDLHAIMPRCQPSDIEKQQKWRNDNVISNPHLTSLYMHQIFTTFHENILEKNLKTKDYWYRYAFYRIFFEKLDTTFLTYYNIILQKSILDRYEWQHRGSAYIHFLWIENAPDMENLNWEDTKAVDITRQFFDKYISAWNPRTPSTSNQPIAWTNPEDPCLLSTP